MNTPRNLPNVLSKLGLITALSAATTGCIEDTQHRAEQTIKSQTYNGIAELDQNATNFKNQYCRALTLELTPLIRRVTPGESNGPFEGVSDDTYGSRAPAMGWRNYTTGAVEYPNSMGRGIPLTNLSDQTITLSSFNSAYTLDANGSPAVGIPAENGEIELPHGPSNRAQVLGTVPKQTDETAIFYLDQNPNSIGILTADLYETPATFAFQTLDIPVTLPVSVDFNNHVGATGVAIYEEGNPIAIDQVAFIRHDGPLSVYTLIPFYNEDGIREMQVSKIGSMTDLILEGCITIDTSTLTRNQIFGALGLLPTGNSKLFNNQLNNPAPDYLVKLRYTEGQIVPPVDQGVTPEAGTPDQGVIVNPDMGQDADLPQVDQFVNSDAEALDQGVVDPDMGQEQDSDLSEEDQFLNSDANIDIQMPMADMTATLPEDGFRVELPSMRGDGSTPIPQEDAAVEPEEPTYQTPIDNTGCGNDVAPQNKKTGDIKIKLPTEQPNSESNEGCSTTETPKDLPGPASLALLIAGLVRRTRRRTPQS